MRSVASFFLQLCRKKPFFGQHKKYSVGFLKLSSLKRNNRELATGYAGFRLDSARVPTIPGIYSQNAEEPYLVSAKILIAALSGIVNALSLIGELGSCVVVRSEYVSNVLVTCPVPVNGSPGTGVAPGTPTDVAANAEGIT